MCSSGDSTAAGLEKTQAANSSVFFQDYQTSFAEQENIANELAVRMQYMASNPMGLPPQELASLTTSNNEQTATMAKQAIGAAGAYAASHGGAGDVGGGGVAQLAGQIGTAAEAERAAGTRQIGTLNAQTKQANMWAALGGLGSAGSTFGGMSETAAGGSVNAANASVNAGKLLLASQQAGWADVGGMMSAAGSLMTGIGGLGG